MLLWFVFCVSAIVPKVLKCLFFPVCWAFLGWFLLVYLCLEGLGVFVFLVFGFLFGVGFVSVCLLCFVLWLDVVVSVSVFFCVFFLCFFVLFFVFFGGFKGQVRWPEGPPHLALNPPYFLFLFLFFVCCFCFFVVFCCFLLFFVVFCCFLLFFVVFFVFVFFGGFKGQVRWPKGPPHLALNPPFFVYFLSSLPFLSLFFNRKTLFSP